MSDCPRVMTDDQIVEGLKAGRTLCVDRRDAPELPYLLELEQQGLVASELIDVDEQYSYLRFRWRRSDGNPMTTLADTDGPRN